jgi:hypothetical protein
MKRIALLALSASLALFLSACGHQESKKAAEPAEQTEMLQDAAKDTNAQLKEGATEEAAPAEEAKPAEEAAPAEEAKPAEEAAPAEAAPAQ